MQLPELYEQYGRLMVQKEIMDNKVIEVKRLIVEAIQKPTPAVDKSKDNEQPETESKI